MKPSHVRQLGVLGLCLATVLVCTFFGCGSPAASQPDDFRGIKWGAEVSSVSGLNQIADEGNLALYEKSGDLLQMDEVRLEQVVYGFYKNRFYMGMVYFPAAGFKRIEEMLTRQLGQPAKPDNTPSKLIWDGDSVSVLLTLGESSDQGRLVYIFKPIQLEVELKK
ncbi:MAG: hypothetical protein ABSF90_13800 [Syntrophobacteraceae bacterium]|jgi:hypothetical protein